MLVIRNDQIKALERAKLPPFYKKMAQYTQERFPDFVETLQVPIIQWAETTYLEGEKYGIESERDVFKLINIKCIFGDDVLSGTQEFKDILNSADSSKVKLNRLMSVLSGGF